MERFNALGRGSQMMLVSSVLLFIVSFFHWQEVTVDLGPLGSASGGVSAWDDIGGILMGILTIVLIAWLVARIAAVKIPVPVSGAMIGAALAGLILILAVLKNLLDDYSTFWSYLGVVLAIVIAAGAWLEVQAAGGVDSLKSEASSFGGSRGTSTMATSPPAPPPPAPASRPDDSADAPSGTADDERSSTP